MLSGLKGALALPRLHLHPSILGFLQGEGGELLEVDRKREVRTTRATLNCRMNNGNYVLFFFTAVLCFIILSINYSEKNLWFQFDLYRLPA